MTSPVTRRVVHAPITALSFLAPDADSGEAGAEYLLVGEDTQLKVYEVSTGALRLEVRVFRAQAVHGIRVSAGVVLLWGARSVAVGAVSALEGALLRGSPPGEVRFEEGEAKDWIYDGLVGPGGDSGVLVTAHNEAVEVSWDAGKKGVSFGRAHSPSGPILYAARARWLADGSVLVAGGTAFGEILVWTCRLGGERKGGGECRVLHILAGHDGSIFGVDISDEIRISGGRTLRLLASCSDDRTIRVWDIGDASGDGRGEDSTTSGLLHEARETGFGYNAPAVPGGETKPEVPIAVAMGHISRIWDVKFPPLPADGPAPATVPLYSFGEDSTAQAWDLDLRHFQGRGDAGSEGAKASPDAPATLTHRTTFSNHDGKHIWAAAMSPRRSGACGLATGGADGKVSLIEDAGRVPNDAASERADGTSSSTIISHETLSLLGTLEKEVRERKPRHTHDFLQRYAFLAEDTLLAVTRSGKLLIGSLEGPVVWAEVAVDAEHRQDLKTCCAMASPATGVAVIGTRARAVYLYADGRLSRLGSVPGMALNMIPLGADGESATILVTVYDNPEIRILTVNLGERAITSEISLHGVDGRFVLTAAARFYGYLVIGSLNGFMEVYDVRDGGYTRMAQIEPRSDGAITTIQALPGQTGSLPLTFLSTHRDGKYRIYELNTRDGQQQPTITTQLRHEIAPPFGPQIEDAWFLGGEDGAPASLILSGFRSKDFVVWNETAREHVAVVDCGGAHRAFAHTKSAAAAAPGRLHFAYTKASRVHIHSQTRPPSRTVKAGSHGREVRAIASAGEGPLGEAGYFATASEDTTVRVWQRLAAGPRADGAPFRCVAAMAVHTTGLQCVRWCGDHLLSSGGNEDFFVWRVAGLSSGGDFSGLAVFCEAAFADKTPGGDLRITDFDVEREDDGGVGGGALLITMAFSNSVFKTYRYAAPARGSQATGRFEALGEGGYTGACLTQVRHLARRPGNVLPDVITASTDGHVALWTPADGAFALSSVARVHQSSIKSLDLRALGDDSRGGGGEVAYLVTTTGDDNAIAVTSLARDGGGALAVSGRTVVASAHAAAITGVVELSGGRVATVSNDQRLKIWEVGCGSDGRPGGVRLVGDLYSGVADAGAVGYIAATGEVVVGGVGMEIWGVDP